MSSARRAADLAWRENKELRQTLRHLQGEDGGGNGGDMDIWQQSVETRLGELSSRILWLAGGLAVGFVTLLSILLARTDGLGDRLAKVESSVERLDERTAAIQKQQDGMDAKLDKLLAK